MKIELTEKEIELLLLLINDVVTNNFNVNGKPIYSLEEINLIEKFENALKLHEISKKNILDLEKDNNSKNLLH